MSISAVRDDDKKLVYVIAALEDITDYRNALNSLKEAEQFSRTVIQAAGQSIIVYNPDLNIRVWNHRIEEATGISSAEAIGRSIFDVLPFTANDPNISFFYDALQGKETRNAELIYERPGIGNKEYVEMSFSPHYNSTGEVIGVIHLTRNITAAKQSEAELVKAMQELENAYKLQAIFLNNVTHDVRTPLTAIQGYIKMLLEGVAGEINDFQSQLLQKVLVSSDQLLEMVNDMLMVSKSRNSKLTLNPQICRPDVILSRTVSSISPQSHEKGLNLIFNRVDCANGLYDQQKVTMILLNILGNAVKFTDHGSIEVSITKYSEGVEVIVADTGIGIGETSLPSIFDEFVQLEYPREHKNLGFGLGLSIVANMIELMNGCLVVSSHIGTGTAFTIRIPELKSI
jgi:PAS domain S-box-containing protein